MPPSLPTPIRSGAVSEVLQSYHDKKFICHGLVWGFSLGFDGVECATQCVNSPSFLYYLEAGREKVLSEVALGRVAGPFSFVPLPLFKCSPLAVRLKPTSGKVRLLHNLSAPYNSLAVNRNIPDSAATVSYQSIDDVLDIFRNSQVTHLAKSDISEAYRLIPLRPADYHLTGFQVEGSFYYDRCLPMGARSACATFERFSSGLKHALITRYAVPKVVKVLDDFIFLGSSEDECKRSLSSFVHLAEYTGVPLALNKTVGPVRNLTFLGYALDCSTYSISIPEDKVVKYVAQARDIIHATSVTLEDLQAMIGKLTFCVKVVKCGRSFLRNLITATRGWQHPRRVIAVTPDMAEDLAVWMKFLGSANMKAISSPIDPPPSAPRHFYTDSSGKGFGGVFGKKYIQGRFAAEWSDYDINVKELYPMYLLLAVFGPMLRGHRIIFHSDNKAAVISVNKWTSGSKKMMAILRKMVQVVLNYNLDCTAVHIRGSDNWVADALSRSQVTRRFLSAVGLQGEASHVPFRLRTENWRLPLCN